MKLNDLDDARKSIFVPVMDGTIHSSGLEHPCANSLRHVASHAALRLRDGFSNHQQERMKDTY